MKLLDVLRRKYPVLPVKQIKRLLDAKCCTVNGRIETISTKKIVPNDTVLLALEEPKKEESSILYEDDDLVILNKAAGVICEQKNFKGLFLVHRLDKETSGVLILAKSQAVKDKMIELFESKEVKKTYLAIVDGPLKKETGKIDISLEKKEAITFWKLMKRGHGASLLLCEPITGRTHQIRIHLSDIGHPIIGDHVYGKKCKSPYPAKRHLLHAYSIAFSHPSNNKQLKFTAKPPADFLAALKALKLVLSPS